MCHAPGFVLSPYHAHTHARTHTRTHTHAHTHTHTHTQIFLAAEKSAASDADNTGSGDDDEDDEDEEEEEVLADKKSTRPIAPPLSLDDLDDSDDEVDEEVKLQSQATDTDTCIHYISTMIALAGTLTRYSLTHTHTDTDTHTHTLSLFDRQHVLLTIPIMPTGGSTEKGIFLRHPRGLCSCFTLLCVWLVILNPRTSFSLLPHFPLPPLSSPSSFFLTHHEPNQPTSCAG